MSATDQRTDTSPESAPGPNPLAKLAIELGPLVVFFVAQRKFDIYVATGAFMVAMVASLIASRALFGKLPVMPLVTTAFVLVMGGLTLALQDATFIKMKPTIVNSLFGIILLGGLAVGKLFLEVVFADSLRMTREGWRKLTLRLGLFFFVLAALNEYVWRNYSEDTWTSFKVFGIMPLTLIFFLLQGGLMQAHSLEEPSEA